MNESKRQITRIAAYGLLVQDSRILLCRISPRLPDLAGQWTLPGGGLDFGEDPADAMVREVREEAGLDVRPTGIAAISSNRFDLEDSEHHGVRIIYETQIVGGTLTNEVGGTTDLCEWVTPAVANRLKLVGLAKIGLQLAFYES